MASATFRIWRGEKDVGRFQDYSTEISEGMVVLDAVHNIQAEGAGESQGVSAPRVIVAENCERHLCGCK